MLLSQASEGLLRHPEGIAIFGEYEKAPCSPPHRFNYLQKSVSAGVQEQTSAITMGPL